MIIKKEKNWFNVSLKLSDEDNIFVIELIIERLEASKSTFLSNFVIYEF